MVIYFENCSVSKSCTIPIKRLAAREDIVDNITEKATLMIRRNKLLARLPLVVAALVALFWAIWQFVTGSVPIFSSISLGETTYQLPFVASRLADIPASIIFTSFAVNIWYALRNADDPRDLSAGAIIIAILAVVAAFVGVYLSEIPDLMRLAIVILFVFVVVMAGASVPVCEKKQYNLGKAAEGLVRFSGCVAFGVGLGSAMSLGGAIGLGIVITAFVACSALSLLVYCVVYGIRFIYRVRRAIVKATVNWLLARDIPEKKNQ